MNNEQAKNGFKTFVVTLFVSLVIFGALYYLITGNSKTVNIDSYSAVTKTETVAYNPEGPSQEGEVWYDAKNVKGVGSERSYFGNLTDTPVDNAAPTVLAGADEATESSVPDTGSNTLAGTIFVLGSFSVALYAILVFPRKFALSGFEKEVTRN